MSYVSSLLEILRATLRRLEGQPEFSAADAHARELRRYLLIAIADLEERIDEGAVDSATLTDQRFTGPLPSPSASAPGPRAGLPTGFPPLPQFQPPAQFQPRSQSTLDDAEDDFEPSRTSDDAVYLVRLSPRPD